MKNKLIKIIIITILFYTGKSYSQDVSISKDSITQLLDLSFKKTLENQFEEAFHLQKIALKLGKELEDHHSITEKAYKRISDTYFSIPEEDDEIKTDLKKPFITILLDLSYRKGFDNQFEDALSIQEFALKWARAKENDSIIGEAYDCIGTTYISMVDYEKAEDNYKRSLKYLKKANYRSYMIYHHNNLGALYLKQNELAKSKEQCLLAKQIAKELDNKFEIFWPTFNIGLINYKQKDYDIAYDQFREAITYYEAANIDHPRAYIKSYLYIANVYKYKGKYKKAFETIKVVDSIAIENEKYDILTESEQLKSDIYSEKNDYKSANNALLKKIEYLELSKKEDEVALKNKTILNQKLLEKEKTIAMVKEVNLAQTKVISKSKTISIMLLLLSIITLIIIYLLYRSYSRGKKFNTILTNNNKELIKAKEATEYASKLKANFFSTISHELRTPLYAVTGITNLLIEEDPKTEQKEYLDKLKSSGEYLLGLITNILFINKFDSNKSKLNISKFNLETLLLNITKSFPYSKNKNNNKVHISIDEDIPLNLKGDALKITQVIINLIENATKFTSDGNIWITVNLLEQKEQKVNLHFSVEDDGIGMTSETTSKIFSDFYQESMDFDRSYEGSGLGLGIVKRLLKVLGSSINVESTLNKGSKFYFDIELDQDVSNNIEENNNVPTAYDLASKHILVVDDNAVNQMITKRILKNKNATVTLANNGVEAINSTKNNHFDLILMDIHMPLMDGYLATKKIREFNAVVPIVALTASKLNDDKVKVFDSGMNDFILKPFKQEHFFKVLQKQFDKSTS